MIEMDTNTACDDVASAVRLPGRGFRFRRRHKSRDGWVLANCFWPSSQQIIRFFCAGLVLSSPVFFFRLDGRFTKIRVLCDGHHSGTHHQYSLFEFVIIWPHLSENGRSTKKQQRDAGHGSYSIVAVFFRAYALVSNGRGWRSGGT